MKYLLTPLGGERNNNVILNGADYHAVIIGVVNSPRRTVIDCRK